MKEAVGIADAAVRNIRARRNNTTYRFRAEIIKDLSLLDTKDRHKIKREIRELFTRYWKDIGTEFFDHIVDHAKWLLLLRYEGPLVGLAVVHKKQIANKTVYNFKTNVIIPRFRSFGLMGRMNHILFNRVLTDNIISNRKLGVEIISTTPNMRALGFLANVSSFIYPDPRTFDRESRTIPPPDDETWQMAREYNKQDYPRNMKLSREGCVVENEEHEWPHCVYEKEGFPLYKDEVVNELGRSYLQYDEGCQKMFIIHAKITLRGLIKYLLRLVMGRV